MPMTANDGVRIRWEERGAGEPVLLIQGLGYTLEMWHRVAPVLAAEFRVLMFDNRGVGGSDAPPGPYAYPDMARDAIAVLDAAGVERAHVYGISMGGAIAQQLVIDAPERVRSLVLGATYCGGPSFHLAEPEVYEALEARGRGTTPDQGARLILPYIYDRATPRERVEEDVAIRVRHYPSLQGYLGQAAAALGWDATPGLGSIGVPTLVIRPESDRLVNPENSREVAARIPGARLVSLPGASHLYPSDRPAESNALVLEFLREATAREVAARGPAGRDAEAAAR
ncbi:MAG: alpha/beta fold hydrolase [Actinomycetota bacterium]